MTKEAIVAGIIGLFAGIVIAPLFSGMWGLDFSGRETMMGPSDRTGGMMARSGMGDMDRHFIEQMIPHHDDAILMAELALAKAEHAEIRTLAENIKRTQSEENAKMRAWYQSWYGTAVPDAGAMMGHGMGGGMMHGGMMGDTTDRAALERAAPFDREFIEQMIPHHQMAVMMATMALQSAARPEIQALARAIIDAQTDEINQMREWYRTWYGR